MKITMEQITKEQFLEFIEAVLERPKLYTPMGSFYEIVSFLDGYGSIRVLEFADSHSVFTPFLFWFAKRNNSNENKINWRIFREKFSTDNEALVAFQKLFKEFIEKT